MKILIVEDDDKTASAIRNGLLTEGYDTLVAATGNEGVRRLQGEIFDLVVLEWMLPGRDGIAILRSLREKGADLPVVLRTARDAVEDRVLGLDSGADDYLVKPFAFPELLARLRVLSRSVQQCACQRHRFSPRNMNGELAWNDASLRFKAEEGGAVGCGEFELQFA
jgi:two-component system copper resistance phosphate regulon response regulator CusR